MSGDYPSHTIEISERLQAKWVQVYSRVAAFGSRLPAFAVAAFQ
jgi:hypothetical protein